MEAALLQKQGVLRCLGVAEMSLGYLGSSAK